MSTVRKNFFFNLMLTLSNVIFPAVTFPYVSRILGAEGMGKIQFINSFVQYFVFLAALGIPIYGIREIAKVRNEPTELKRTFTSLLIINLCTCLSFCVIYASIVWLTPKLYTDYSFYLVAMLMLILSFCNIDWFFSGLERFKFIAIRSLTFKLIFLGIILISVKNKTDVLAYLWVTVGAAVLNNVCNIISARKFFTINLLSWIDTRKHFKPLFYIFSTVVAASIYASLDTIILGFLKGYRSVGYYSAASRLTKMTIPFLTALSTVLMPQISAAFKEQDLKKVAKLADTSFDFVFVLGIPMSIGLIALAPELIMLFSGKDFAPAVFSMQIMAPVVLVIGLSTVFVSQILTPAAKDKENTISVIIGLSISVALNFILIPRFSFIGATLSNLIAEIIVLCGYAYFSFSVIKLHINYKLILSSFLVSLLFFPIITLLRYGFSGHQFQIALFGMLLCGGVYLCFQVLLLKNSLLINQMNLFKKKINFNKS